MKTWQRKVGRRALITAVVGCSAGVGAGGAGARAAGINETFMVLTVQGTPSASVDTAAAVSLISLTYDGSVVSVNHTYGVPSASSADALTLTTLSGQHDGMLRMSGDGTMLTFGGYRAVAGTSNPQISAASSVNRVIGTFNLGTGVINTSQALSDAYNFAAMTSVVTQDGKEFWTGGSVATTGIPTGTNFDLSGGIRYVASASASTSTNIGLTQTTSGALQPDSMRSLLIDHGNLYLTTPSQGSYKVVGADGNTYYRGLYQVGTNVPITHNTAPAYIPVMNDLESGTLPGQEIIIDSKGSFVPKSDLVFLDLNSGIPGVDTAYGTGGKNDYQKWSLVNVGGGQFAWKQVQIWDLSGANGGSGITDINGLSAFVEPSGLVDLFATSDNGIYHFTDSAGYEATQALAKNTTSAAINYVYTLTGSQFRGIAAVPEPAAAGILVMGGLLLASRRRSRR